MRKYKNLISINIMLIITLFSCQESKNIKRENVTVDIVTVQSTLNLPQRSYTGIVEESYASMLSFQVAGNIQQIYIDENQYVEKGQLLASLDRVILQNSYEVAFSTFKQTEDTYNRLKILYEQNSIPEIKWIEIQTGLQATQSNLNIAKRNLENCDMYAPFSGIIAKRIVDIGTNVMAGTPIFNLIKLDNVKVRISIPEKEISDINIGQMVDIKVMALASNNNYTAKIKEKGAIANLLSHTYDVKIQLENRDKKLLPGMICDVNIYTKETKVSQIIIPNNAIMVDNENKNFVWLVDENGIAFKRLVTVGNLSDLGVAICHGLSIGEKIITDGNHKVSEGMKVAVR